MAQNGGEALRRVSASADSRLSDTGRNQSPPPPSRRDLITLDQPRPGSARALNEYIDTPKLPIPKGKPRNANRTFEDLTLNRDRPNLHREQSQLSNLTTTTRSSQVPIITSQPGISLKKEQQSDSGDSTESHRDSIICQECGRCKCDACTTPRPLPSKWICNDKCLCSAETTLDYCTCVCCIKGVFYHCAKDYDLDNDVACADDPCSCSPHRRCLRWSCMGSVALLLPCLWCYWPMKGCLKLCSACYSRYHYPGCRCRRKALELASRKGLLDSNSDC